MTIDKTIHTMEYYDQCDITTQRQAREKAVGVMQKYQKIEQLIDDYKHYNRLIIKMTEEYWLERIKEVLEDGNVD